MKKYTVDKGFINKQMDAHISYEITEEFKNYEDAKTFYNSINLDANMENHEYKELSEVEIEDGEIVDCTSLEYADTNE